MSTLSGARCVVVGAGGFIGGNLCRALLAQGADVVGMGRPPRYAGPEHRWIDASLGDLAALAAALEGADCVFHLLGSADPGASNENPGNELRVTAPASLAILEACRVVKPRRVVYLSSGGTVYRPGLPIPIAEDALTDPVSAYGIAKLTVEKYCALFHRLYGLDTVVLRVANPFGPLQDPERGQGFIAKLIKRSLTGEIIDMWGDGSAIRDFLYIDDAVEAIMLAATCDPMDRLFNVGSGVPRTLRSVVEDVRSEIGDVPVRYTDARAADTPANLLDITRARDQLGWAPRTAWPEALRLTRDWIEAANATRSR